MSVEQLSNEQFDRLIENGSVDELFDVLDKQGQSDVIDGLLSVANYFEKNGEKGSRLPNKIKNTIFQLKQRLK